MPLEFESLESVLDHPEMRGALRKFLSTEFSDENLQLMEAVDAFRADCQDPTVSEQTLRRRASQISELFLEPNSPKQVNLSSGNLRGIQAELANLATKNRAEMNTMFDAGSTEVSEMMRRDTLRRFLASDLGKSTATKLNSIERLEAQLEKLKTNKAEQAKALFQGGSEKVKRKLQEEIDALRTSIGTSILPQAYVLPQLPAQAQAQAQAQGVPGPPLPPPGPVVVAQPPPVVVVQPPPPQHQHDDLQVENMSMEEFNALEQGPLGRARGVDPGARVQDAPQVQDGPEEDVQQGLDIEEMSMEELAGMQQGRSRAVNSNIQPEDPTLVQEQLDEHVQQGLEIEEMSMEELAGMQQGRSRAVNSNVKPGSNALPPQDLNDDAPSTKKGTSVRESWGKKPEAPTTGKPGQRTHI